MGLRVNALLTRTVPVPGATAIAVRPHPIRQGQTQALVISSLGITPLRAKDGHYLRVEPPLQLLNEHGSRFDCQRVYDAVYDPLSQLVLLACGHTVYGLDQHNRVTCLAGEPTDDGTHLNDGPAASARFIGAQRLATTGDGVTFIRDRCNASKNGFVLRTLHEAALGEEEEEETEAADCAEPGGQPGQQGGGSQQQGGAEERQGQAEAASGVTAGARGGGGDVRMRGSGARAVASVHLGRGGDPGPHAFTYDPYRKSLLYATRGRSVHQLLPHGITTELAGTDYPPIVLARKINSAAAIASASDSASDGDDEEFDGSGGGFTNGSEDSACNSACMLWPSACSSMPFTNIQALAADPTGSGDVFLLDGVSGSRSTLKVLRADGQLDTLEVGLRIGPKGSGRWPRLAALPGRRLAVFGVSHHDMMIIEL